MQPRDAKRYRFEAVLLLLLNKPSSASQPLLKKCAVNSNNAEYQTLVKGIMTAIKSVYVPFKAGPTCPTIYQVSGSSVTTGPMSVRQRIHLDRKFRTRATMVLYCRLVGYCPAEWKRTLGCDISQ